MSWITALISFFLVSTFSKYTRGCFAVRTWSNSKNEYCPNRGRHCSLYKNNSAPYFAPGRMHLSTFTDASFLLHFWVCAEGLNALIPARKLPRRSRFLWGRVKKIPSQQYRWAEIGFLFAIEFYHHFQKIHKALPAADILLGQKHFKCNENNAALFLYYSFIF